MRLPRINARSRHATGAPPDHAESRETREGISHVDLKHLRQITEICRAGSFSLAARRLHISQPTLSRSIALIEARMGVKFFERDGGIVRPTEYGLLIADRADIALRSVRELVHDVENLARGETGRIRIGVGGVTRVRPLADVVDRALEIFPHLEIETRNEIPEALVYALKAGRYDLIFCYREAAEQHGDLIRIKLYEDRNVMLVHPGHPLLSDDPVTPQRLLKYRVASTGVPSSLRRWAGDISPEAERNMRALVTGEHELVRRQALTRNFVAFGPSLIFASEIRDGSLVELPLPDLPGFECWMVTTASHWQLSVVKKIAEIAKPPAQGSQRQRASRKKSQRREKTHERSEKGARGTGRGAGPRRG